MQLLLAFILFYSTTVKKIRIPDKGQFESFSYIGCFDHISPGKNYKIQIDSNRRFYLLEDSNNLQLHDKQMNKPIKFVLPKEEYEAFLKKLNAIDFTTSSMHIKDMCTPAINLMYTSSFVQLNLLNRNTEVEQLLNSLVVLKEKYKMLQKNLIE